MNNIDEAIYVLEQFREQYKNIPCNIAIPKFSSLVYKCANELGITPGTLFVAYMNYRNKILTN